MGDRLLERLSTLVATSRRCPTRTAFGPKRSVILSEGPKPTTVLYMPKGGKGWELAKKRAAGQHTKAAVAGKVSTVSRQW